MITLRPLLLALLALPAPALANDTARFTIETYSLPAAVWMKIPTRMRDDHPLLRNTLLGQLPKGSIRLLDRAGGFCRSNLKNVFESQEEILVPSAYAASKTSIYPFEWVSRMTGSSLVLTAYFSKDANLGYTLTAPDPPSTPLLQTGKRLDLERTTHPIFSTLRLDSSLPIAPVSLAAIAPDPDPNQREQRLLVCFLVADGLPASVETDKRAPGYTIELMGLRGSSRTTEIPTPELLKNLLRRSDAMAFTIGATQTPGPRSSLDAVRELPFATQADKGPGGPVPTLVESITIGTILSAQLSPIQSGKVPILIQINHDWRDPQLPTMPGKGENLLEGARLPYTMQLRVRQEIEPGIWTLLVTQPLSDLFGPDDRETKGESCYLFGRLTIRE